MRFLARLDNVREHDFAHLCHHFSFPIPYLIAPNCRTGWTQVGHLLHRARSNPRDFRVFVVFGHFSIIRYVLCTTPRDQGY